MLECLILGDSIALGVAQFRSGCEVRANVGISTSGWLKRYRHSNLAAKTAIISLGVNDGDASNTYGKLRELRTKITSGQVYWIVPTEQTHKHLYQDVNTIAGMFGDQVIQTNKYQADRVHPTMQGYKELAEQTRW
jgi:lysophospholipase L1-like esterase